MNWGKKILIVYSAFVIGIMFLVFKSSSQKMDLVTTDYYAKELKYQEKIDEINRVTALTAPVKFELKSNSLTINFPNDFAGKELVGEAVLYCPSDKDKDLKVDFSVRDVPVQMAFPHGNKGLYELHLSWKTDGISYYFEKKINL